MSFLILQYILLNTEFKFDANLTGFEVYGKAAGTFKINVSNEKLSFVFIQRFAFEY